MPLIPLIFKGGTQEEKIGPDSDRDCSQCGCAQHFTIYALWDEFGVWPFRSAKWNREYVTRCDVCGKQFKSSYRPPEE